MCPHFFAISVSLCGVIQDAQDEMLLQEGRKFQRKAQGAKAGGWLPRGKAKSSSSSSKGVALGGSGGGKKAKKPAEKKKKKKKTYVSRSPFFKITDMSGSASLAHVCVPCVCVC